MIELKDILYKVKLMATSGHMNVAIGKVCFDSRKVEKGDLFVAVKGTRVDGHQFIDDVIQKGCSAVVSEQVPRNMENVTFCQVADSAAALGIIASNYYGNPSHKLKLVGVTGTNGKTTTVFLLYQLFRNLGYNVGMLSTVHNKINDDIISSTHTTADALQLNALMKEMAEAGCTHCFMEASSHAIHQKRVSGLNFDVAVFTNITHDHLDYHKTFDEYIAAKKKLFDDLASDSFALVNVDDKRGAVMLQNTRAEKKTYSVQKLSDFKSKIISNTLQGLELEIDNKRVWFTLIGDFNAYNILAAYATAVLLGEDPEQILTSLSALGPVPGRFERVKTDSPIIAVVDYAHTPDALKNVLDTIQKVRTANEQVITVVGCGGNRDKTKRPVMANIACKMSDKVILTSDNPRNEEPETIIEEMKAGVSPADYKKMLSITDRKEAIKTAVALARDEDIILVAGKGHETYQEIKGVKYDFDDRKIVAEMIELMSNKKSGHK